MNTPTSSHRARQTPASPIRKLQAAADAARGRGVRVNQLNIGQPDLPTPPEFLAIVRQFAEPVVAYAPSAGLPETISAWQRYFRRVGTDFSTDQIIVTTGGSEAIIFALLAVTDPGDEVLVFEPLYPNYVTFAQMAGITLRPIRLTLETGFRLPPAKVIAQQISRRTRAIIVCNPANPTGAVLSDDEQRALAEIARVHGLFIIADETYREIVFRGQPPRSFASIAEIQDRVILVDSVSKRFNCCGARIGCIASTNQAVIDAALKFAQGRLSSPTIEQMAVVPLLADSVRFTDSLVETYARRNGSLTAALKLIPSIRFAEPAGALYVMLSLPVDSSERFCQWLVESFHLDGETVALAPGPGFYVTSNLGHHEARIAYVLGEPALDRSAKILAAALEQYPGTTR